MRPLEIGNIILPVLAFKWDWEFDLHEDVIARSVSVWLICVEGLIV